MAALASGALYLLCWEPRIEKKSGIWRSTSLAIFVSGLLLKAPLQHPINLDFTRLPSTASSYSRSDNPCSDDSDSDTPPWFNPRNFFGVEPRSISVSFGPALRLRGGGSTDDSSSSEAESEPAPKRKRKANSQSKPRKRQSHNGKGKERQIVSDSESELGIRVTARPEHRKGGMFVDEIIHLESGLEVYPVPRSGHRVAYILDVSHTPELLNVDGNTLTIDGYVKKECQDAVKGPTGAIAADKLAKVVVFDDEEEPVLCRRSALTCNGFYKCSLSSGEFLHKFQRWDDSDKTHVPITASGMAARDSEATSVAATASASSGRKCNGTFLDSALRCGGHTVLRKFTQGAMNSKVYFIGCSKWARHDAQLMSKAHMFIAIPSAVRESILVKLFHGEAINDEDDDTEVLAGFCETIVHPSHLTRNSECPRNHYRDGLHIIGKLKKQQCGAKLSLLIPMDQQDLRIIIIPRPGVAHTHPSFPRTKIPSAIKRLYRQCIDASGTVGSSTLRVDKSSSTRAILKGRLPQELHPGMINSRKRRDMALEIQDRYIHYVTTQADNTHVIITINPDLAALTLEARWIMVDTTFAVVHGKTNEWKLVIWLSSIEKPTEQHGAFVMVWNGIFTAIETITGKKLNFQVFSSKSKLLGAIGDSEGAQAQGLGDVIILRQMNLNAGAGLDVDSILMLIWKTCIVHFNRGVLALKAYISENDLAYLIGFPYLMSDNEIEGYYTFCAESSTRQVQNWWEHKLSYPWLLPSLNRHLSRMSNRHWDLTPSDTNPIEGSHAQDNQVNDTGRSLLEAILLYVHQLALNFTWLKRNKGQENPIQVSTGCTCPEKRRELESLSGREARKLREEVKAGKQKTKDAELEILELRRQIDALHGKVVLAPKTLIRPIADVESESESDNDIEDRSPPASPMAPLNLFPTLPPATPIAEPRSEFDYPGALASDIMETTFRAIIEDHPLYPIDGSSDNEVLASDPYSVV
ncbi:hypothetical protein B0H16DRAFT_1483720 [Mycena metata]|uniref:Uncharacterized protein n=1 Tax=Mycena metata TaxID=1033252 RepID=A0AAD7GLZ9_9AGAR|nr:hypothetical protein B0H16DRAFT_1483720 [Mycena metata]